MHVITYSSNFAPPNFAARGNQKHSTMSHCLHLYVVCLPFPDGAFFLFSVHKAHTFERPDSFVMYGKV